MHLRGLLFYSNIHVDILPVLLYNVNNLVVYRTQLMWIILIKILIQPIYMPELYILFAMNKMMHSNLFNQSC